MCEMHLKNAKRIMIIDDDLDLLMLLERSLMREGYEIETAASLPEAEYLLSYFTPDLILLDINVNGEDGRKLCWKLKKQEKESNVKVIMISGHDYSKGRAALFGADDLVPKPFHMDYLFHKLDTLLLKQHA